MMDFFLYHIDQIIDLFLILITIVMTVTGLFVIYFLVKRIIPVINGYYETRKKRNKEKREELRAILQAQNKREQEQSDEQKTLPPEHNKGEKLRSDAMEKIKSEKIKVSKTTVNTVTFYRVCAVLLVVGCVYGAITGYEYLIMATAGVGFIALGVISGILARIFQAEANHTEMINTMKDIEERIRSEFTKHDTSNKGE